MSFRPSYSARIIQQVKAHRRLFFGHSSTKIFQTLLELAGPSENLVGYSVTREDRVVSRSVFDHATFIRATHGFKQVDSLHLGAAIESGSQRFLTNDLRLAGFPGPSIEVLA